MKSTKKEILTLLMFMSLLFFIVYVAAICKRNDNRRKYAEAKKYIISEDYDKALEILNEIYTYKDVNKLINKTKDGKIYQRANELLDNKDYEKAIKKFLEVQNFKDSNEKLKQAQYGLGIQLFDEGKYSDAEKLFTEANNYQKSSLYLAQINVKNREQANKTIYEEACNYLEMGQYDEALENFNSIKEYKDSEEKAQESKEKAKRLNLSQTICAATRYVLAITQDNKVKAVGANAFGQCDVSAWENIVSIDGYGEITVGLKDDGSVETTGNLNAKQKKRVESWEHIIDVAAGYNHIVALKSNGEVVAEGHNGNKQCDIDDWRHKKIIDIDAGWRTTVGLTEDGELLFAGKQKQQLENEYESAKEEWKSVIKISVSGGQPDDRSEGKGGIHVVGLKADKTVVHIGKRAYEENSTEDEAEQWENIVDIAAGGWYIIGLREDGKIFIAGEIHPEFINWNDYIDIATGYGTTLILKDNGTMIIFGARDGEKEGDGALDAVTGWTNLMLPNERAE